MYACEQLNQGRFAGPVLADNGMDFTPLKSEINRLQRVRPAESLIQFFKDEQGRGGRRRAGCVLFAILRRVHRQLAVVLS
jgi:hypothetical protein